MPRKTAKEEATKIINKFMSESEADILRDIKGTRQPSIRAEYLAEMDALDRMKKRYYNWSNGAQTA